MRILCLQEYEEMLSKVRLSDQPQSEQRAKSQVKHFGIKVLQLVLKKNEARLNKKILR